MALLVQSWAEWFNYWMSQSTDNWHPLSWAVDGNPIVIGLHLLAGTMLALSFYTIGGLMTYATYTHGFTSRAQKLTALFFLSFIFLCGTTFVVREVTFFTPIFWVYGSIKLVTAIMATLTAVSYAIYYKRFLEEQPTVEKVKALQSRAEIAERKVSLLSEHLETWSKDVGAHIEALKGQHKILAVDLRQKGLSVPDIDNLHTTESDKDDVMKSLDIIKLELENLTDKLTNLDEIQ